VCKSLKLNRKYKMNKLMFIIVFVSSVFTGLSGYSQTNCASIHCDCENVADADKDPGLKALCEYYERSMKELCNNGEKGLKCHKSAKGPNFWQELNNSAKKIKLLPETPIPSPVNNTDNIDNLLAEIRNAENKLLKYAELHNRLEALQENTSGLALAMEMSDLFMDVHEANRKIEFAIMFITYTKEYSDGILDMGLAKMIEPIKDIGELDIDQLDMKFELANIFKEMKNNGLDVLSIFGEDNYYQNEDVVSFIKECYASNSENATKRQMQELRDASNRIFLRKMDNLIPIAVKSELTNPIYYINKGVLYWNEKLVDESINTLNVIAEIVEKKQWDQKKIDKVYSNFKKAHNEELWPKNRYDKYFITISKELPIVWELLKILFVN